MKKAVHVQTSENILSEERPNHSCTQRRWSEHSSNITVDCAVMCTLCIGRKPICVHNIAHTMFIKTIFWYVEKCVNTTTIETLIYVLLQPIRKTNLT